MKRRIFWSVFFTVFLDCRSTNLLRLFSGNLPAMFHDLASSVFKKFLQVSVVGTSCFDEVIFC